MSEIELKDEYYTPLYIWDKIKDLLKKQRKMKVYEPFYGEGHTRIWLENAGFENLMYKKESDFFLEDDMLKDCEMVLSNPPFSKKYEVLERLVSFDKPFVLILPSNIIFTQHFRAIFKGKLDDLAFGMPEGRLAFIKNGKICNRASFYCLFCFYKIDIGSNCVFV